MPRRNDLTSVLVIGSGPIVIGQGCEFDYSGTQACRVLKSEGIRVSLVNSNPATIMNTWDRKGGHSPHNYPLSLRARRASQTSAGSGRVSDAAAQ